MRPTLEIMDPEGPRAGANRPDRDDLRALADRLDSSEDVETSPFRIVYEGDVLAAAKALRALAAAQETPQEPTREELLGIIAGLRDALVGRTTPLGEVRGSLSDNEEDRSASRGFNAPHDPSRWRREVYYFDEHDIAACEMAGIFNTAKNIRYVIPLLASLRVAHETPAPRTAEESPYDLGVGKKGFRR